MKIAGLWLFIFIVGSSTAAFAQGPRQDAPPVRLGGLDTANVTCDVLLQHTKLISSDSRWKVTHFTVSFTLPDGKTYGPFATQGSELNEATIKTIKRLKKTKAEISIQEIGVIKDGSEKFTYPIILRYNK